jgi:hypothetical protein
MTLFAFNTDDVSDAVGYRATDITGWRLLGYTVSTLPFASHTTGDTAWRYSRHYRYYVKSR